MADRSVADSLGVQVKQGASANGADISLCTEVVFA